MRLPLATILLIAWRYTRASKKSGMLSFLSTISMAGLVLGVSLLVIVLSVMNGFERELKERILGLLPQASIYQARGIEDWPGIAKDIERIQGVNAIAPFIQLNALLTHRQQTVPALIYGIELALEKQISLIERYVAPADLARFESSEQGILLGVDIAKKLDVEVGNKLMVIVPSERARGAANIEYLHVAGLIRSGSELDQALVLADISGLAALRPTRSSNNIDGLRLRFDQLEDAPLLAREIVNHLGPTFYQSNWQRTHGNLYHAIRMSKTLVGLLMSLIVGLAAFNVISTLILVVVEKRSNIAILCTLGASSHTILMIFMIQGLIIGAGGVAIGVVVGCALVSVLEPLLQLVERMFQTQFLHSDVYPLTAIPAEINVGDLSVVVSVSMTLVFLATLYPAWRAARFQPAEVLRYE